MKRMQGRGESFRNVDIFRELLSGTLVDRTEKRPTSGIKPINLHSPDWKPESRNSSVKRSRSDDKIFSKRQNETALIRFTKEE